MKYPIGIQSFEEIRTFDYVYIDKTDLIYKLTESFKYVFLGRPRRFGKSLLMSTIQAYFEGRRELFQGLAIEGLASVWAAHPVLHFDLNNGKYDSPEGLERILDDQLSVYEKIYGRNPEAIDPQFRLRWLIHEAHAQTGRAVVILVDEYDKPVLQAVGNDELDLAFRNILKPFYGTLKSEDAHLRFAMLTGVSKFGKLSVFSDLNNIKDISLLPDYAGICGITKNEILDTFAEPIAEFAESAEMETDEIVELLRKKYDGYRFTKRDLKVFNPYSLLNAFADKEMNDYWFESGTPTFLVKLLQSNDYDLSSIEGCIIDRESLYKTDNVSAIPLLYQSGYLTIKDYNPVRNRYILGYPNQEVETGFLDFLLPFYSKVNQDKSRTEIDSLTDDIESGSVESFMSRITSLFYSIPYTQDTTAKVQEDQVRNLMYIIFKLLGFQIHAECHMSRGRSDAVVWTSDHIYVFELKVDSTPEAALAQILEKGYAEPYSTDGRPITLIGVNYNTTDRAITGWITQNMHNDFVDF